MGGQTEEEPVPKDFRVIVLVPEEVERLSMGEGVTMVWKADPTEGRWIVKSKL